MKSFCLLSVKELFVYLEQVLKMTKAFVRLELFDINIIRRLLWYTNNGGDWYGAEYMP